MTMKKKKTFISPSVTVSPFYAENILANSCSDQDGVWSTGQLDFGSGNGAGTTGGTGNGGGFDWTTGQLNG
jgi:hypothetical protein